MQEESTKDITLPKELFEKLEKRRIETNFKSLSEYITYILEQVLTNLDDSKEENDEELSEEEKKEAQARLKRLESMGYLD